MNGYVGHVLRVNLGESTWEKEPLKDEWISRYIGGVGMGYRYLIEELDPGIDPLGPENKMLFMTGPFTGTLIPTSSRLVVITKSPVNNTILLSHVGGSIAGEIKFAGYDAIILEGKAEKPVYLYVKDDAVEIRDAGGLWGKDVHETTQLIREESGDERVKVIGIGPAGENLVKFASLTTDSYHAAGRGGIGAVLGSKNVKAVAVRGTKGVQVKDMVGLLDYLKEIMEEQVLKKDHEWTWTDGTPFIVDMSQEVHVLPTRNFQDGQFEEAKKINSDAALAKGTKNRIACLACPLSCGRYYVKATGEVTERAQYETVALGASNCGIGDLDAVAEFSRLCNHLGMDTISAGNVIGFAMEMTEMDIHDFGVGFGDVDAYLQLTSDIAYRNGVGDELAEGVRSVAEKHGAENLAVEIKGLEFPGYDPRGSFGMALAYATSSRGACHQRAFVIEHEAFGEMEPCTFEGKAEQVIKGQNFTSVKESLLFCDFWRTSRRIYSKLFDLVTDYSFSYDDLVVAGERIWNLGRLFNVREGYRRKEDHLPDRMYDELGSGPATEAKMTREAYEASLSEYYELRGWDHEGIPTLDKLEELGLSEFADIVKEGAAK